MLWYERTCAQLWAFQAQQDIAKQVYSQKIVFFMPQVSHTKLIAKGFPPNFHASTFSCSNQLYLREIQHVQNSFSRNIMMIPIRAMCTQRCYQPNYLVSFRTFQKFAHRFKHNLFMPKSWKSINPELCSLYSDGTRTFEHIRLVLKSLFGLLLMYIEKWCNNNS